MTDDIATTADGILRIVGASDEERAKRAARDAQIRRLAERLKVAPIDADDAQWRMVVFVLEDGTHYDLADLVHGALDAIERASAD